MGMYDNVWCEYPLPDGYRQDGPFQTKSFDCELVDYRITAEGMLMRKAWTLGVYAPGDPGYAEPVEGEVGYRNWSRNFYREEGVEKPYPWTGTLRFYDITGPNGEDWREYHAVIVGGQVAEITAHHRLGAFKGEEEEE